MTVATLWMLDSFQNQLRAFEADANNHDQNIIKHLGRGVTSELTVFQEKMIDQIEPDEEEETASLIVTERKKAGVGSYGTADLKPYNEIIRAI